jgi:predicted MFS family arabinose efflux permease
MDNLLRGAVIGALPLLYIFDALELWHVYVAAGFYGTLFMVSLAGGPTLIPALVPKGLLPTANALEMLSFTIGGVLAPPLAGILASRIGAPNLLLLDSFSYFVFAAALAKVKPRRGHSPRDSANKIGLIVAARFVATNPILRSTTLMYMIANIGGGLLTIWLPIYADGLLSQGLKLYGILLGVIAIGEVLSSFLSGAISLPVTFGRGISFALILSGIAMGSIVLSPRVFVAIIGLFLYGLLSGPLTIWAQTLRMRIIPAEMRGRVFALLRTMMQGAMPAGGVIGGLLVPVLGLGPAILITAGSMVAPGLLGLGVKELQQDGVHGEV